LPTDATIVSPPSLTLLTAMPPVVNGSKPIVVEVEKPFVTPSSRYMKVFRLDPPGKKIYRPGFATVCVMKPWPFDQFSHKIVRGQNLRPWRRLHYY
jgi:hypothetical protein